MTIQDKANEQYFPVVLFIRLQKVVLTFESVDDLIAVSSIETLFNVYSYFN